MMVFCSLVILLCSFSIVVSLSSMVFDGAFSFKKSKIIESSKMGDMDGMEAKVVAGMFGIEAGVVAGMDGIEACVVDVMVETEA